MPCSRRFAAVLMLAFSLLSSTHTFGDEQPKVREPFFGVRVVDQTGRGVPLVELKTTNEASYWTDSDGWAAIAEPGLMGQEAYFHVASPGYEFNADGFGFRGVRLRVEPGATATIKLPRQNIAERVVRLTGEGIFRDSQLLGLPLPEGMKNLNSGVTGQDSVQVVPYQGKLFWLWGDTNIASYPLGNFQTTCATSPLPVDGKPSPDHGIQFEYLKQENGQVRHMAPLDGPGPVWLFGLFAITDADGTESLYSHFTRHKSLSEVVEHGVMKFDDEAGIFKKVANFDLQEQWRGPQGNAFVVDDADGVKRVYFAHPLAHTRVAADEQSILDPHAYESLVFDSGEKNYVWKRDVPPTKQRDEQKLLRSGAIPSDVARYQLIDVASDKPVVMHGSSIAWNEYRQKWTMIGVQAGDQDAPSFLGEVWYAEAESPTGPWNRAIKIATHPKYTYYNPRQHPFFATDNGRVIYFEGTYTHTFSATKTPTPRYDYNQLLYRLDLSEAKLKPAQK
ncbi:DUF4185 domain-containing protein [Blastopirellula sp. JC732]|uniref:DUF4185 domain-containing protein n=1 Tax=Blastopirellula sediminis TaxID=2894196 RepID=A0A9X1MHX4_9BACT|nr:DUF4185 domain-containing protein [Blastopirellula sediminis]MCC9607749.1 DUF4185 domain-containing protein [Blastopirellula sediminis]MCC9627458.1 DUF4185 domain-containing protein [Blastopirellula sediminis]